MIRTATEDDLERLREMYRDASLNNPGDRDNLLGSPEVLVWSFSSGVTRVAVDDADYVLGFVTTTRDGDRVELDDLFVDPEEMRRGVATHLLADVAASAAAQGARRIEVTGNLHAAEFYASVGFVRTGEVATLFGPAPRLILTLETGT